MDVQYVLQLEEEEEERGPPVVFTEAPHSGGIGCEGRRTFGKADSMDTPAVITFSDRAPLGAQVYIWGGWATGHEPVTLTKRVAVVFGEGIVAVEEGGGDDKVGNEAKDGEGEEEEAEEELAIVDEERTDMELEIVEAEEDAFRALEEKREDTIAKEHVGEWDSEIDAAEEEVVEALEERKDEMEEVLNDLKTEVVATDITRRQDMMREMKKTTGKKRAGVQRRQKIKKEAQMKHGLEKMWEKIEKRDAADPRMKPLVQLEGLKEKLEESVKDLRRADGNEHERHRGPKLDTLPLKANLGELRKKVKKNMGAWKRPDFGKKVEEKMVKKMAGSVNDVMKVKKASDELRERMSGGRGGRRMRGASKSEGGEPASSSGQPILIGGVVVVVLIGALRWYMNSWRRKHKGRRNL